MTPPAKAEGADQALGPVVAPVRGRVRLREICWLGTLAICLWLVFFSPLRHELKRVRDIHQFLDAMGPQAELIFIGGAALITALGFPRMLIYPVGGVAFGFGWGLTWSVVALLLGGYLPFLYARWGGRSWFLRRWPRLGGVADYFGDRSYRTVVLLRVLPLPGFITNVFCGITRIKQRSFLLGTLLGSIPPGIPAALLGHSMLQEPGPAQLLYLTSSILLFAVLWIVIPFRLRHHPNIQRIKTALSTSGQDNGNTRCPGHNDTTAT